MVGKAVTSLPGSVADAPDRRISNQSRTGKDKTVSEGSCGIFLARPGVRGGADGRGLAPPGRPGITPDTSLDSFNYKSAKCRFDGPRYHTLAFREFVSERLEASVRMRGIDAEGVHFSAAIPCTYRWTEHRRRENLAVIYSFVEYLEAAGYDSSTIAFITLTVRHPTRLTYPAAAAALAELRRGWGRVTREIRRADAEYLAALEPGELNGYPHYHIILAGASEDVCKALIASWCTTVDALPIGQNWSIVNDIRLVGAYIAKYMSKTLDSELDYKWLELCYRERVRTWSMSRSARAWITAKYRNPRAGLGTLGEIRMSWMGDRAEGPVSCLPDK